MPPVLVLLAALVLFVSGCSMVQHETAATTSIFKSVAGMEGKGGTTNVLERLQSEVMREADLYVGMVAQATDDLYTRVPTIEARDMAQQWKLNEATAAYVNATGEHPTLNAVDMVVLATLSRYVVEDYWVGEKFGDAALPLLETHRTLETNAWSVVQLVLTPAQQDEVRKLLIEYRQRYPHLRYVAAVRMRELTGMMESQSAETAQSQRSGSLFSLLYLNPLSGLDPTTQAIQQTRLLAARITYYLQRAPTLWCWQAELTLYQVAAQPEAKQVLSDLDDVSQSTKVFARTAEGLPKLVNDQRVAAINQIFDRLAVERTNLLTDLTSEEAKVRGLLNETRQTLQAGGQMADSINAAIQSLDAFVHYVSPPDTNAVPTPPDTNSHPFNVLDYGKAAGEVGAMATNLNTLLTTANQSMPQAAQISREASADLKAVVNHAFRLGLVLIAVAGVVTWLVVLACRRISRKTGRD